MEEAVHVFQEMEEAGLPLELLLGQNILKGFAPIRGQIWDKKCYKQGKGHLPLLMHMLMLQSFVGSVTRYGALIHRHCKN